MILTGKEIIREVSDGNISITPFSLDQINPNSYNYRLGETLKVFSQFDGVKSLFEEIRIPKEGYVLEPNKMYLSTTSEEIGSSAYAMSLIGRSSMGRLGLFLQVSADLGHTTSCHNWTLELVASVAIRVYPGMEIGQVSFWENQGQCNKYEGFYGNKNNVQESIIFI
jgi:dCTP deaminase